MMHPPHKVLEVIDVDKVLEVIDVDLVRYLVPSVGQEGKKRKEVMDDLARNGSKGRR